MIFQLAGVVGVDPGPLTFRELSWMAQGRGEAQWAHTSALLAAIWSANTQLKKPRMFKADEFNPFAANAGRKKGLRITAETIGLLKAAVL